MCYIELCISIEIYIIIRIKNKFLLFEVNWVDAVQQKHSIGFSVNYVLNKMFDVFSPDWSKVFMGYELDVLFHVNAFILRWLIGKNIWLKKIFEVKE